MSLTVGHGPFGPDPTGAFDTEPPHRPLLFWEPFPKRLRIVIGGEPVVDSTRCLALHQTGESMVLCVPAGDVERDRMTPGETVRDSLGAGTCWTAAGMRAVARSIDAPPANAQALGNHFIFAFDKAEAWYLDDDLGHVQPRDPYHRVDVHRASCQVRISVGEVVVADSRTVAVMYETAIAKRYYLPPDAVRVDLLVRSETVSGCPYKGDGQHWHVKIGDQIIEDACWSLSAPVGDATTIPRWFSFYAEKVDIRIAPADGRGAR